MKLPTVFTHPMATVVLRCSLVFPGLTSTGLPGQEKDVGLQNPLIHLTSRFADAVSHAERAIPRAQKYEILNQVRHRIRSDKNSKNDPGKHLDLAADYRRFRFYPEATVLYQQAIRMAGTDHHILFQAHRALGELAFVADNDLEATIDHYNRALKYSPPNSVVKADMLGRLGSYYLIDGQVEKMKEIYRCFNKLPERAKIAVPDSYLKANLYSGRFTNDPERSEKYFAKARKIISDQTDRFPEELVLSIFAENSVGESWNAPNRIARLAKLVTNRGFDQQPKIRQIEMQVFLAFFLERHSDWDRFHRYATMILKRWNKTDAKQKRNVESSVLACEAIAIFCGSANLEKKKWNSSQIKFDYWKYRGNFSSTKIYFPATMTSSQRKEVIAAYSSGLKLLQAPSSSREKKISETPARKK